MGIGRMVYHFAVFDEYGGISRQMHTTFANAYHNWKALKREGWEVSDIKATREGDNE